ncbi:MAG: ATP-binding protein [Oscillospiraceae bacterium]|nr:ATP-binding protein [Oscillospiraceae bacterium]
MFIGRKQELAFLEDKYTAPGGQLVVLYGRRRVGKTAMLQHFCANKPHVFYSCREISDKKQLADYSERILQAGIPAAQYLDVFPDWEKALSAVLELPATGAKKLLVIDEFPYMCKGNASIPSILQILWDEKLKDQNVMIILCGSAMSFIEKKLLSEKNPLYGRATGVYKMKELPFDDAIKFFPNYSDEDKMLAYAVLGGIPHYLRQFEPSLSLSENIIKHVLTKGCALYSEVEFLIRQELREPALYNTIVEAVALGNTKLNDIYTKTGLEKAKISVYLRNLMELEILEREFSVTSSTKEQATSTRGLYRITDNFFRFWFHFVFPHLSDLETGDAAGVFEHVVHPQLNHFTSPVFEIVCREYLRKLNRKNALGFRAAKLGRWWGKLGGTQTEVDVVAIDAVSKHYVLGECKFRNAPMDTGDLDALKAKAGFVKQGAAVQYALFSKSGFSEGLATVAEQGEGLRLFSLSDIVVP